MGNRLIARDNEGHELRTSGKGTTYSNRTRKYNATPAERRKLAREVKDFLAGIPNGAAVNARAVAHGMGATDKVLTDAIERTLYGLAEENKIHGYVQMNANTDRNRRVYAAKGKYQLK